MCLFSSVQSLSQVQLFETPWTATWQGSLSITNSQSLLKLMFIKSVIPSNHLILCHPLLLLPNSFPESGSFPVSWLFTSGGQSFGASASVLLCVIKFSLHRWCWFLPSGYFTGHFHNIHSPPLVNICMVVLFPHLLISFFLYLCIYFFCLACLWIKVFFFNFFF